MPDITAVAFEARAEECVRLASLTQDELLKAAILTLRQTYLSTARGIRNHSVLTGAGLAVARKPPSKPGK